MTDKKSQLPDDSIRRTSAAVFSDDASHDVGDVKPGEQRPDQDAKPSASKSKPRKKRNLWALKITIVTLFLSAFISFLTEITSSADNIIVTVILLLFLITASILFDGIGVAVTSCDITPIVSMASKKVYGAKTAMWLVKNNEKVANVCNDVIGDIFGIISGACGAAIVVKLMMTLDESWQRWLTIGMSSIISALTIGGKAFLKNIAISNSKEFVMFVARVIGIFHPEERRRKKKQAEKRKKYENAERAEAEKTDATAANDHAATPRKKQSAQKGKSIKPEKVRAEQNAQKVEPVLKNEVTPEPETSDTDNIDANLPPQDEN